MRSVRPSIPRRRFEELPAHVVVGDYPEALAVLRRRGIDLDDVGAQRLSDFAQTALLEEIEEAIAWRPTDGTGEEPGAQLPPSSQ